MRPQRFVLGLALALGFGCTQDFDAFSVDSDAALGRAGRSDGSAAGGAAAAAGRPDASAGGAAGSQGAAGGNPDGSAAGGAAGSAAAPDAGDAAVPCPTGQSNCNGQPGDGCEVNTTNDPNNCGGCGRACSLPNATSSCVSSACQVGTCNPGYGDCDSMPANGCERDVSADPMNCGGCGRSCTTSNVASLACAAGRCSSTCDLGWANCSQPVAPGADDGCELDVRENAGNCGGCGNSCTLQNDMVCGQGGSLDNLCGCAGDDARCQTGNGDGNCLMNGLCQCQTDNGNVTCRPGEVCVRVSGPEHACRCNGGAPCAFGQVCCQTPAGCASLQTDEASCGACGRACPAGFTCTMGRCVCTSPANCSAGGSGSCNSEGRCVCGGTTCAEGQRCLPTGSCG